MTKLNYNRPIFNKNLAQYIPKQKTFKTDTNHIGHDLVAIATSKPHYGKLQCKTCNKFVKWLSEEEFRKQPK